jgi:hypothetical protein
VTVPGACAGDLVLAEPGARPAAHPGEEGERGGGAHPRHSQARQAVPRHRQVYLTNSVLDPDPHVFGPPGPGSISQRYGSGSSIINQKTLIPTVCDFVWTFYL